MNSMQVGSYFIPQKVQAPQVQSKTNAFGKLVQNTMQTLQNQGKNPAKDAKTEGNPLLNQEEKAKNETVLALPTGNQDGNALLQNLLAQLQTTPPEALLQQLIAAMAPVTVAQPATQAQSVTQAQSTIQAQPVTQTQPSTIPVVTVAVSPAVASALSEGEATSQTQTVLQEMEQIPVPQAQGAEKPAKDFANVLKNTVGLAQPQNQGQLTEQVVPQTAPTAKAELDKTITPAAPQVLTQVVGETKNLDTQTQIVKQQITVIDEAKTKLPVHKAMPTTVGTEDKSGESLNLDMTAGQPKQIFSPDKVHIKVGELSAPEQKAFAADVADTILVKMSENSKEFQVELNPKELGKINIKLSFIGEQATVILQATNPKTQQLLAANAEGIRAIVEAHAGQEAVVVVREDAAPAQYQEKEQGEGQKQQREQRHEPTKEQSTVDFLNRLRLNLLPQEIS